MTADHTYDVVFLALARDCEATLPGALLALKRFEDHGLRAHLVVGENDSTDGTREMLDEAAAHGKNVTVVDTAFMAGAAGRLERMALGRQRLAEHVREMPEPTKSVCVIDLDEPFLESVPPSQLAAKIRRLENNPSILGISATSSPTYYDLLAFEDDERSFAGLETQIKAAQRNPIQYYRLFKERIYPAQESLTSHDGILCTSAFNGMALYRYDTYKQASYLPEDDQWVCEHLTFNRSLNASTGKHMVIDGELVLPMPAEHGRRSLPGFIRQRATKLAARIAAKFRR